MPPEIVIGLGLKRSNERERIAASHNLRESTHALRLKKEERGLEIVDTAAFLKHLGSHIFPGENHKAKSFLTKIKKMLAHSFALDYSLESHERHLALDTMLSIFPRY